MIVAIPEKLKSNPTFAGFSVPFITLVDKDGIPDFQMRDDQKWVQCARGRLCRFCGKRLGWWIVFVGEPKCVEERTFKDPAMHEECARYALDVRRETAAGKLAVAPQMFSPWSKRVAVYLTRGFDLIRLGKGAAFHADAPKSVEWETEMKGKNS